MRILQIFISSIFLSGLFITPGQAQSVDTSYTEIKPALPTQSGEKIEVVEIFWYGCSHCFSFEPHVKAWLKTMPEDVVFLQVPGVLNSRWAVHARGFFAAQKMDALEKFHTPLFNALHVKRRNVFTRDSLVDFAADIGLDKREFARHYDSNETEVKMKQAFFMARDAKITGVPSLIVNGRYLTSASQAGSFEKMLETVDYLIREERRR